MQLDIIEQILRAVTTYLLSVLSYRFIWKSKSVKKNLIVGLYFFAMSIVVGFLCRQAFKLIGG